jgi:hypothetical protein
VFEVYHPASSTSLCDYTYVGLSPPDNCGPVCGDDEDGDDVCMVGEVINIHTPFPQLSSCSDGAGKRSVLVVVCCV